MLISFDGTFIVAAISFIIFMIIMKYILFKPMSTVIEEREKFYEKNSSTARESKEKAQKILKDKEEEISKTRASSSNLIKEVSDFAKKTKEEKIKSAKQEANQALNKRKEELEKQSTEAKEQLRGEVESYVRSIASKILEKDITISLNDEKLNRVITYKGEKNA